MQIHQAILDALAEGISIELSQDVQGLEFDMKPGTKSGMQIRPREDGKLDVFQRYDIYSVVETFDEICDLVRTGMHGRRFIVDDWDAALKKRNLFSPDDNWQ